MKVCTEGYKFQGTKMPKQTAGMGTEKLDDLQYTCDSFELRMNQNVK